MNRSKGKLKRFFSDVNGMVQVVLYMYRINR
jgi:hypothetical protein